MNKKSIVLRTLVALLCISCTVFATYSWFDRSNRTVTGNRMKYEDTIDVNGTGANLTMTTQMGRADAYGNISYGAYEHNISGLLPGGKIYFRTKIDNTGSASKVTLLLKGSSYSSSVQSYLNFGVLSPMNTLKSYNSGVDIPLVRNAHIDGTNGQLIVDWYIYLDDVYTTSGETITLGSLYLFAN